MGKFCHMATYRSSSKNTEKISKYGLSNIELVLTHMVLELGMFGIAGKFSVPFVTLCKKIKKNLKFTTQGLPKTQLTIIWLIGILRVKMPKIGHLASVEAPQLSCVNANAQKS